ncbi:hypothetical protein ACFCW7_26345 [Paenibacillus glucanolyticus]
MAEVESRPMDCTQCRIRRQKSEKRSVHAVIGPGDAFSFILQE